MIGGSLVERSNHTLSNVSSLISSGTITIKPSGDIDDYFTFSTASDIPTITATGAASLGIGSDITLGANKIKFTHTTLLGDASYFKLQNPAEDDYRALYCHSIFLSTSTAAINFQAQAAALHTGGADGYYAKFNALDSGSVWAEVARWMSAADPYFQIGRDDTGVAVNAVTDMLVLQAGAGANNESAGFGLGLSIKLGNAASEVEERASIDVTLATATNGAEDANMIFNLMDGGAAPSAILTLTGADKSASFASYVSLTEMAAPGAGAANTARVYALEGAGDALTDLCAVFQDGTVDVFAQEATEPDSPIFQFPDNTCLGLTMRKPDRKTIQFVATFPDGRDFVMREIRYPTERW